jgi:SAM-dependent methyltransferase
LPQNQFGLIFAYNYFNYRPIEVIRRYFKEIFLLLRPGGTLLMTYNNCDRAQGVGLVEHSFMCYTPLSHLCRSAEDIGFEFTFNHNGQGDLSWAEFHKPGDITSLRGGQTLAKIVAKTD